MVRNAGVLPMPSTGRVHPNTPIFANLWQGIMKQREVVSITLVGSRYGALEILGLARVHRHTKCVGVVSIFQGYKLDHIAKVFIVVGGGKGA